MLNFRGKVAIVTGGASGIGLTTAQFLARLGAQVCIADIDGTAAARAAASIKEEGGTAIAVACDVGRAADVEGTVAVTYEEFGRLDVLHNNAALLDPALMQRDQTVLTIEPDDWDRVMAINVRGVMLGCKYAIPRMIEGGGGAIVNTSSTYGMGAYTSLVAYGTSKAAINQLTRYVATAFGSQGVRCNAVAPSLVATAAVEKDFPVDLLRLNAAGSAMNRLVTPMDVAKVIVFLASDAACNVTGQIMAVDAGTTAQLPTAPSARALEAEAKQHGGTLSG